MGAPRSSRRIATGRGGRPQPAVSSGYRVGDVEQAVVRRGGDLGLGGLLPADGDVGLRGVAAVELEVVVVRDGGGEEGGVADAGDRVGLGVRHALELHAVADALDAGGADHALALDGDGGRAALPQCVDHGLDVLLVHDQPVGVLLARLGDLGRRVAEHDGDTRAGLLDQAGGSLEGAGLGAKLFDLGVVDRGGQGRHLVGELGHAVAQGVVLAALGAHHPGQVRVATRAQVGAPAVERADREQAAADQDRQRRHHAPRGPRPSGACRTRRRRMPVGRPVLRSGPGLASAPSVMATKVARAPRGTCSRTQSRSHPVPSLSRSKSDFLDPQRGPIFTPRFVVAVLLVVLGIAWMAYYYIVVRVDPTVFPAPEPGKPGFMADLENWNYLIGFGLIFVGLVVAAHPSTPLGRNRGVVITMLTCFILGLLWICTYYVFTGTNLDKIPVFNDLEQYNLMVGIGFMAVGFSYATRWE